MTQTADETFVLRPHRPSVLARESSERDSLDFRATCSYRGFDPTSSSRDSTMSATRIDQENGTPAARNALPLAHLG